MTAPDDPFAKPAATSSYGAAPDYPSAPPYVEQPSYGGSSSGFGAGTGRPELASWGRRVGGALIDGVAACAIYLVGILLGVAVGGGLGGLLILLGLLGGLGFTFYNLVQQGNTGQTLGKRQLGTRLLREQDGRPVGAGLSIARQFVHVIDGFFLLGYLWPLWDDKKQTFSDKILETVVVRA